MVFRIIALIEKCYLSSVSSRLFCLLAITRTTILENGRVFPSKNYILSSNPNLEK